MSKAEEPGQTPAPAPAKSKVKLLLIVVLVAALGAGGFFGWRYFTGSSTKASASGDGHGEKAGGGSESKGEGGHAEGGEGGNTENVILNFEPFLVNLADKESYRYLRVTIRLHVATKSAAEKITSTEVLNSQIRDSILSILTSKVADQIITSEGKEQLKQEITDKLNTFLPGKPVKGVFFSDFVVQL
jgi:flagellar FliL protein